MLAPKKQRLRVWKQQLTKQSALEVDLVSANLNEESLKHPQSAEEDHVTRQKATEQLLNGSSGEIVECSLMESLLLLSK